MTMPLKRSGVFSNAEDVLQANVSELSIPTAKPSVLSDEKFDQQGCDYKSWEIDQSFQNQIFLCPDPEKCPGTCPEEDVCLQCWGSEARRWSCSSYDCPDVSPSIDPEEEVDRCILPTVYSRVCVGGMESVGCNSCAKDWYEGPDGWCRRCGSTGSLPLVIVGILSPLLAVLLYKILNVENTEERNDMDEKKSERALTAEEAIASKKAQSTQQATGERVISVTLHQRPKESNNVKWFFQEIYTGTIDCLVLLLEFVQAVAIMTSFEIDWKELVDYDSDNFEYEFIKWVPRLRKAASMHMEAMTAKLGLKPGCATPSFQQRFAFAIFAPCIVASIFWFNYYVGKCLWLPLRERCIAGAHGRKHRGTLAATFAHLNISVNQTINAIGTIVCTFFISISRTSLSLFITFTHPSGDTGLVLYPEVFAGDTDWYSALPFGIIGLLVYFFGIFTFLAGVAYAGPLNYHNEHFRARYNFFFNGLKPNVYWWRLWIMLRALMLNVTTIMGTDSRLQVVLWNLIYTVSLSLSLLYTAWGTKAQNVVDACSGLAIIILLCAISFHMRGTDLQRDHQGNHWLVGTEISSLFAPILVLIACASIPFYAFYYRVHNTTKTYNLAQRFRDLMLLVLGTNTSNINRFICDLNDNERQRLEEMMGTCFANLLYLQPADSFWKRRIIPELPEGSDTILYATEDVVLSKLAEKINDDVLCLYHSLKQRIFVQWFLDEVTMAYYKMCGKAPTMSDLFNEIIDLSGYERPPPPQSVYLQKECFVSGSQQLCPILTHDECVRCFDIVDTVFEGSLDEEQFIIIFNGIGGACAQTHVEIETPDEVFQHKMLEPIKRTLKKVPFLKTYFDKSLPETIEKQKRECIISQKNKLQDSISLMKSQSDPENTWLDHVKKLVKKPAHEPHFSMREAISKLHVILEGERGSKMITRSRRLNAAASKIQKFVKEGHFKKAIERKRARVREGRQMKNSQKDATEGRELENGKRLIVDETSELPQPQVAAEFEVAPIPGLPPYQNPDATQAYHTILGTRTATIPDQPPQLRVPNGFDSVVPNGFDPGMPSESHADLSEQGQAFAGKIFTSSELLAPPAQDDFPVELIDMPAGTGKRKRVAL